NNKNEAVGAKGSASTAAAAAAAAAAAGREAGISGRFQNKPKKAHPTIRFVSGHVEKLSASLPIVTLSSLDQPCTVNLDGISLVAVVSPPGQSGARDGSEGGNSGRGSREGDVGGYAARRSNSGGERGGVDKRSENAEEDEEDEGDWEEEEEEEEERAEGLEGLGSGDGVWASFPRFQGGSHRA
ncbi:unnamed protein product, partial [Closterium sp. NIES-54]